MTIEEREREPLTRLVVIFDVTLTSILKFYENSIFILFYFPLFRTKGKRHRQRLGAVNVKRKICENNKKEKSFFVVVVVKEYNLTAKERKAIYLQWR